MPFSLEFSDQLKQKLTEVCDSFNVVPNQNVFKIIIFFNLKTRYILDLLWS
jgi:hypothetical protein